MNTLSEELSLFPNTLRERLSLFSNTLRERLRNIVLVDMIM